jgi:hypothetical protein
MRVAYTDGRPHCTDITLKLVRHCEATISVSLSAYQRPLYLTIAVPKVTQYICIAEVSLFLGVYTHFNYDGSSEEIKDISS